MGDGRRRGIRGSGVRDLRVRQRESESKAMVISARAKMTAKALMVAFSIRFHFDQGTVLSPGCAIFRDGGRQSLEEQPTMDKVVSLLISVGIITFGAWVAAATIAKGWPLVWTLMALFPLLTGFISLYGSIKGTED